MDLTLCLCSVIASGPIQGKLLAAKAGFDPAVRWFDSNSLSSLPARM